KQAYLWAPGGDDNRCEPDPPRSLANVWSSPTFQLVTNDTWWGELSKCDFPSYLRTVVMLSARAAKRLSSLLDACGELLPIFVNNDRDAYYFFNVTRVVNAVDMRKSKFLELPSGAIGPCELLVFDPGLVPSEALFFKNTQMGPITEIFATEQAVAAV